MESIRIRRHRLDFVSNKSTSGAFCVNESIAASAMARKWLKREIPCRFTARSA